nr:aldehyde ferredoxin oxidoreductase family protein [Candidatus Njordarchaeum guaymaensis]
MEASVLRVDLTKKSSKVEKIGDQVLRKYIGGRGLGVKILYDELKPKVDPFKPENKLIFMTGPLVGTYIPTAGRFHVITKSPLTGGLGESNCGGDWGPELRFAGYEGIILEGRSSEPVYLWIHDGAVEFKTAARLWGNGVWQTEDRIREELGDKDAKIASIGPAGENLVLIAGIVNKKHRVAARTGVGAVMGSKNLKAIAVKGSKKVPVADDAKLRETVKKVQQVIKENPLTGKSYPTLGTMVLFNMINEPGILPTRNFQSGYFSKADAVSGETLKDKYVKGQTGCWGCPIQCGRVTEVKTGPYKIDGQGPEFESVWALSADCGVDNLEAVIKASNLCNDMGIDTISYGNTVACAMELFEKGKIPKSDLGNIDLRWGSAETVVNLVEMTARRKGFGNHIADGCMRLAKKYGAPELAMHVKGLEIPAYEPRGVQGQALAFATSNRGGCHLRAYMAATEIMGFGLGMPMKLDRFETKGKAIMTKMAQEALAVIDSLNICKFAVFAIGFPEMSAMLNGVTGWNLGPLDMMKAGERIYNLERMFINREGFAGKDDTLPKRFLETPMPDGPSKGHIVKLSEMLPDYYRQCGWEDGKPTATKIKQLEIQ